MPRFYCQKCKQTILTPHCFSGFFPPPCPLIRGKLQVNGLLIYAQLHCKCGFSVGTQIVANDKYCGWWLIDQDNQERAQNQQTQKKMLIQEIQQKMQQLRISITQLMQLMSKNQKEMCTLANFSKILDHLINK